MRFLFSLLLPLSAFSQPSDILLLQKHHRTIRQFFAGNNIEFFTTEQRPVSATIDSIRRDSLFLSQYTIIPKTDGRGSLVNDTVTRYSLLFSLANIGSFPNTRRRGTILTNGTTLLAAGGAFLLLNAINTASEKAQYFGKDNRGYLALGGAFLAVGFIQKLIYGHNNEYRLGRKYQLKYLPVPPKNM